MFGFAKKIKHDVPLDIKRGDIFSIDNQQLYKDSPRKPVNLFFDEPSDIFWQTVNEVIVVSNNMVNKHRPLVQVLLITKSLVGKVTSIDDIRTIKNIYLKEKVGEVAESTLNKLEDYFKHENHGGIVIEYQE